MRNSVTKVVIFIFTDGKRILIEKRGVKNFQGEQYLIPGGRVKKGLENLEQALKRELMEELGIIPTEFIKLPDREKILGLKGQHLIPFLINKWEGNFPKTILDKGNPLEWIEIEKVLETSIKPTRKILDALQKYLNR